MRYSNTLTGTVKTELASHVIDMINDDVITNDNKEDWLFHCFNEDYYIIGYHQASQWLIKHDIDAFEAIGICQDYEEENFGELTKKYDNSETTVNMLVYILGEELLNYIDVETVEELKEELTTLIED